MHAVWIMMYKINTSTMIQSMSSHNSSYLVVKMHTILMKGTFNTLFYTPVKSESFIDWLTCRFFG